MQILSATVNLVNSEKMSQKMYNPALCIITQEFIQSVLLFNCYLLIHLQVNLLRIIGELNLTGNLYQLSTVSVAPL